MKGFFLGLVVAGLAVGCYFYWQRVHAPAPATVSTADGSPAATKKPRKRSRGAMRVARGSAESPTVGDEPVHLSPADLHTVAQGEDLSKPDLLRLDMSNDKELPELSQDQIDERFRAREADILECIGKARPDPETYVPGRVTVKFRIQRAGTVRGVRVEAPAILQRNGLYGCIKSVVGGIRFPAAGSSQILSYPFTLS